MRAWFILLSLLCSSGVALADMIPPMPPMTCAKGSSPTQSHDGAYCYPSTCNDNNDCEKGNVCQLQGLCISLSTHTDRTQQEYTNKSAREVCSNENAAKTCGANSCEVVKRCVPKGTKATPGPETPITIPDKQPKQPEVQDPPKKPEPVSQPTPDSEPTADSQPDSPTKRTEPPAKIEPKGRCAVSPAESLDASVVALFFAFSLLLARRRAV